MLRFARRVPTVYSVEHRKPLFLPTAQALNAYVESLAGLFYFLVRELGIRKVTLLAVGEAAQIALTFLARTALHVFDYLDKVILINCQYSRFRFTHSLSHQWYQSLLEELSRPARLQLLNKLRIISIQTKKLSRLERAENYQLVMPNGKYFQNYVGIESRHMWNLYMDFQDFQVLDFDAFLSLLAEFLVLDSGASMTPKNIEYFFLYKEEPHPEPRSAYKQEFTLHCMESLLELYNPGEYFEDKRCKHLKFRGSETNHSVVIEGSPDLEIFTEKYLKIHPISNMSRAVYYLQSTRALAGIYIFNPNSHHYLLSVAKSLEISAEALDATTLQKLVTSSKIMHFPDVATKVCPEKPLVFPSATGTKCFSLRNNLMIQTGRSNSLVLFDMENPYPQHLLNLHRNLLISGLMWLHLGGHSSPLSVLPYHLPLNLLCLCPQHAPLFVILQTLYTLSLGTAILQCLRLVRWLAHVFSLDFVLVLSPFVFVLKRFTPFPMNEWYGVTIAMVAGSGKQGSMPAWVLFYLNFDYVVRGESALYRLMVMEVALLVAVLAQSSGSSNEPILGERVSQLLNVCFLAALHIYCEEEVAWIQVLFEGYVLLLGALLVGASLLARWRNRGGSGKTAQSSSRDMQVRG